MKIAFTSTGDGWKENIDIRFGRSAGFFIYDSESEKTNYVDNQKNKEMEHGAGTGAAKTIIDFGVDTLITGKVGPRAEEILKTGNVKIYTGIGYGSVEEAYDKFRKGLLTEQA